MKIRAHDDRSRRTNNSNQFWTIRHITVGLKKDSSSFAPQADSVHQRQPLLIAGGGGWRAAEEQTLLFRREREHIAYQEIGMIAVVGTHILGNRPGEDPLIVLPPEQTRRHSRTGNDQLWIRDPALGPRGAQAVSGQQEIRRSGVLVVRGISRGMALQAWRGRAGE